MARKQSARSRSRPYAVKVSIHLVLEADFTVTADTTEQAEDQVYRMIEDGTFTLTGNVPAAMSLPDRARTMAVIKEHSQRALLDSLEEQPS